MIKALFVSLQLSFTVCIGLYTAPLLAQVTSDGTVNTQVNQNDNVAEITGGETRGSNLFHSFQDFSVPTNNEAFFNNANDISNIFSRVTGGNISNIDGVISANSSASLFLINPAGILFGENASLNLGGSFYGSTSSSILFEDGEFSAVDNLEQPLLTVNAPIGLGFRDNPGDIVNRSFVQNSAGEFVGLEVNPANTLALIGGDLNFESGEATATGGNIFLGGLAEAGIVNLNQDGSLSFPQDVTLGEVTLINAADIDVTGTGGGNITVDAQNLTLEAGEFGSSFISSGIRAESTNPEAQAGDININVVEDIRVDDSSITNQVSSGSVGNSGNITINTGSLELSNGSIVDTSTFGQGNTGAITVTAFGDIDIDSENADGFPSGIFSFVTLDAEGDSGGVIISTSNLTLTNGGQIDASTFGEGNAGAITVTASDIIIADGENSDGFLTGSISSSVGAEATGNAGGIEVMTSNLTLSDGGQIDASTSGEGNAGSVNVNASGDIDIDGTLSGIFSSIFESATGNEGGIEVTTSNLTLSDGGNIRASTSGEGDAGSVNVDASGDIDIDGLFSQISNSVGAEATGNGGGIEVTTSNLTLSDGGRIDASTSGEGDAGSVNVNASGDIDIDGENADGLPSEISTSVSREAEGDAGAINILASNLTLFNGGQIGANTFGRGDAGSVNISASEDIDIDGETLDPFPGFPSGITSFVGAGTEGNGGEIVVETSNFNLTNGGSINVGTFGLGNGGSTDIKVQEQIYITGEGSGIFGNVGLEGLGNSGDINLLTGVLVLTNNGEINSNTSGEGNAGSVNIQANEISLVNSQIFSIAESNSTGNAGNILINVKENLDISDSGVIDVSSFGLGNGGNVEISAESLELNSNASISSTSNFGVGGNADIQVAENLTLMNNSNITAGAFGEANGGNVAIDSNFIIAFPSQIPNDGNDIIADAVEGNGGSISINATAIFGMQISPAIPGNGTNDISAANESSPFDLTPKIFTELQEIPNIVPADSQQTIAEACQANRTKTADGGLVISGKGGIPPKPELPLNSLNIYVNGESDSASAIPAPITTAQGKVQPARGIKVTNSGEITLTAYRTNKAGERIPQGSGNCGQD